MDSLVTITYQTLSAAAEFLNWDFVIPGAMFVTTLRYNIIIILIIMVNRENISALTRNYFIFDSEIFHVSNLSENIWV